LIENSFFAYIVAMTASNNPEKLSTWRSTMKDHFSPVKMAADLIKYPVITEKSYLAMFQNRQYTFDVDLRLTKPQIKQLFETLFNVNVVGINTHCPPRQRVRLGSKAGYRARYKRVILTLKEGQSLDFQNFKGA
jgi:large subunit ribosomal protein L23